MKIAKLVIAVLYANLGYIKSWHGYDKSLYHNRSLSKYSECLESSQRLADVNHESSKQLSLHIQRGNVMKLWPLPTFSSDSNGKQIYGFFTAIYRVWKHQHPRNCSEAKFLISPGLWEGGGFGSEIHVDGALLALAIQLGRVLIDTPYSIKRNISYKQDNSFCQKSNRRNKECYYEPWTHCNIQDALPTINSSHKILQTLQGVLHRKSSFNNFRLLNLSHENLAAIINSQIQDGSSSVNEFIKTKTDLTEAHALVSSLWNVKALIVDTPRGYQGFRRVIPERMKDILRCSPMRREHWLYWWRAVATAYIIRPNAAVVSWLSAHRTLSLRQPPETCVAVYVRRGDKYKEMSPVPLDSFLRATERIWAEGYLDQSKNQITRTPLALGSSASVVTRENVKKPSSKILFFNTEDPEVLAEARQWAQRAGWRFLCTDVVDRSKSAARLPSTQHAFLEDEYLAMLLNIEYAVRCDAWVCTLASNFCRIIDELRSTVAAKAHKPYADLSSETCRRPPCIGEGIKSFSWR